MAQLSKAAFDAKYNNSTTGIFKTGQSRGIGSDDFRGLVEDIKDSFLNKSDEGIWQDGWDWDANSDALPLSWPVGGIGYGIGDRGSIGDPGPPPYVAAGVIIIRIGTGTTEADFIFR